MEKNRATSAFATLGHSGRLEVFRLLMRFAPQSARPTEIAETLNLRQNTLSHYLSDLEGAGLIAAERQGRSLFYRVQLGQVSDLVDFLVNDAGRGRPDLLPERAVELDPVPDRPRNVLFVCSGNSARSIFAEAILRDAGQGRFAAFSAGTRPELQPNQDAMAVLTRERVDASGLRSKHVSEFGGADAPMMDFVFTVCDRAAGEDCPPWRGRPMMAHWGIPDPVRAGGGEGERSFAFDQAFADMRRRVTAFTALPLAELGRIDLQHQLDRIGLS